MSEKDIWGDHIEEWFGCDCHSSEHVIKMSYFEDEDKEIYLSHPIKQFRTTLIPSIFDSYFWEDFFSKWYWKSFFRDFWKSYYYESVWKRFEIAWKYCLSEEYNPSCGVMDCITLQNKDLERIVNICSKFWITTVPADYIQSKIDISRAKGVCFEIENDYYRLQIGIEDLAKECNRPDWNIPKHLYTQIQLKKKHGFAKIVEAIYYAFGGTRKQRACEEFVLNETDATILGAVVMEFMKQNEDVKN